MLAEMDPAMFDEWVAYRSIKPDPLDRIAEILKLGFAALCTCWAKGKVDPQRFDPVPKESSTLGPAQTAAWLRARVG